jgi:thiol-disulfide isomerase/thioredoxin
MVTGDEMKKLIVISAVWCPSCLILNKELKEIKHLYPDLIIDKLDYDFDEDEVNKYAVGKILPVIIANNINGKRLIGEHNLDEIKDFINSEVTNEK